MPLRKKVGYYGLRDLSYSIIDTSENSPNFFRIIEFPEKLKAGKNLIKLAANRDNLVNNSEIQIEILDYNSNPIYYEPLRYIEKDGTRVIAIYIYPDTSPGECTIYLAGRVLFDPLTGIEYGYSQNSNDANFYQVPNVIWSRTCNVAPNAANDVEIIFTQYPRVTISEIIQPYLQPVDRFNVFTQVSSSGNTATVTATAVLNNSSTLTGTQEAAVGQIGQGSTSPGTPSFGRQYFNTTTTQTTLSSTTSATTISPILQTLNGYSVITTAQPFFSASMTNGRMTIINPQISVTSFTAGTNNLIYPGQQFNETTFDYGSGIRSLSGSYEFAITQVINSTTARIAQIAGFTDLEYDTLGSFSVQLKKTTGTTTSTRAPQSYETYVVNRIEPTSNFTASFIQPTLTVQTENSSSFADIILSNIEPATGDVYRVKTLFKPSGQFGDFIDLGDSILERADVLIDTQSLETNVTVGAYYENFGIFENLAEINQYWTGSALGTISTANPLTITYNVDTLIGGAKITPTTTAFQTNDAAIFSIKSQYQQQLYAGTEYIIVFNIATDPDITSYTTTNTNIPNPRLDVYISGSAISKQDAFTRVTTGNVEPVTNFNATLNGNFQDNGRLGTRIGTYETTNVGGTTATVTFRFIADEDGPFDLKFVTRRGSFILGEIQVLANKETGFSPNYVRINKRIPTEHLNTPLTFKFQFFNFRGDKADAEAIAYGAIFDGDNTYIDGVNNLITGSIFISNQIGSGMEIAGTNSGYMRSVGYEGFISASNPAKGGAAGWMIWSGSVLPQSGDNYGGVGLELIADTDNYLQYRTYPSSIFIVKAKTFFLGSSNNYISGSNGNLEISSSNFILSRTGNVFIKGNVNAINGTFQDIDIRGKIATMQVSGSSTTTPVSGLSRVMLESWHSASDGAQSSGWYILDSDSYISSSNSALSTRFPWKVPRFLWDPATKTETIPNNAESASYNEIPAKLTDIEYLYSQDGTKYGLSTSGSVPYQNGLGIASTRQTWNDTTGSWSGVRLENIRITPHSSTVTSLMVAKPDYVLVTGISNYVGIEYRVIVKRGSTTLSNGIYTDEFDVHTYYVRDGEHPTIRIPIGAQNSYALRNGNDYVYVNPRVDVEIQWRNNSYVGVSVPNPLTDVFARAVSLHETKILELPRVENLAVRSLRLGDAYRSSVVFDVQGADLSSSFGGANPSTLALRNTAFDVTQSQGYHDLKLRDLNSLGTINGKALVITGSVNITGSTVQVGSNNLLGNTFLSGSIIISGAFGTNNPTVKIYGDTTHDGYIRFDPVSTNIDTSVSASYIYVSGSTNDLYFSQNGSGYNNVTRLRWLEGNLYTGLLHGANITAAVGGTTFNLSSGSGIIVNLNASLNNDPYPTIKFVSWPTFTNQPITYLNSDVQTFLGIDENAQIVQQNTPWNDGQYNTSISIGTVIHQNKSTVNASITYPNMAYGYKQRTYDFIKAFGPLKLAGYTLSTSSSLGLTVGSGSAFADGRNYQNDPNNPSYILDNGTAVSKIFRYYQSGSAFVQDTNNALGYPGIDTTQYNPNGTGILTGTSPSKFYVKRIFWYPNSATKGIVSYYGLSEYSTLDEAQARYINEPFLETPNTQQNAIFLGLIIIKGNANFTSANDYRVIQSGLFRSTIGGGAAAGAGATTLQGLADTVITSPGHGDLFIYSGSVWINSSAIFDSAGVDSVNASNRRLQDSAGNASLSWEDRTLVNTDSTITVDWQTATLNDDTGIVSIDWQRRRLKDPSENDSVDYENRYLYANDGTTVALDWSTLNDSWTAYTPSWTAASSNPSIGNGTLEGWYKIIGKTCFVRGNIAMGSTTTFGSGEWYVSMPFTASHADAILMTANLLDNGSAWYNATLNGARAGFNYKTAIQYQGGAGTALDVNATQPFTWANSDRFLWNGSYELL
jgi:hypothetical protein